MNLAPNGRLRSAVFSFVSIVAVLAVYVWLISFGYWTKWDPSTNFYDLLASAFSQGQLALDVEVNPELLALEDPYNPRQRKGIDFPLDFSLYNGKYYLYFGPTPAVLITPLKMLGLGEIGDHLLVFFFTCSLFFIQIALIFHIKKRFFAEIPEWILPICILFAGLIMPAAWMLTEARVYETAINSGQTFLLTGFYCALTAFKPEGVSTKRLLAAGVLWVFSVGSRLPLAAPIGAMALVFFAALWINRPSWKTFLNQSLAICIPLLTGALILGWYNWARFGSVTETGIYYQLTTKHLQNYSHVLFSPIYILPNAYEYLLGKPQILDVFPYLKPIRARGAEHFPFISLPAVYYTRAITGILYSVPFAAFALISLGAAIWKMPLLFRKTNSYKPALIDWASLALIFSVSAGFFTLLCFFWVETRYFNDFFPSLIPLGMIGFFSLYRRISHYRAATNAYLILGAVMMIASVIVDTLLVFGIREAIYLDWNPALWNQMIEMFSL